MRRRAETVALLIRAGADPLQSTERGDGILTMIVDPEIKNLDLEQADTRTYEKLYGDLATYTDSIRAYHVVYTARQQQADRREALFFFNRIGLLDGEKGCMELSDRAERNYCEKKAEGFRTWAERRDTGQDWGVNTMRIFALCQERRLFYGRSVYRHPWLE